jgi:hypothetical protein
VSASRKVKILVVENDPEWLGLVLLLFQDHVVKPIRDYADALSIVEAGNMVYDVAIVDLNLIDQPADRPLGHRRRDMLGGELLLKLYMEHPSTLRIALTGAPPSGGLRQNLVDRYHVYEFFMKEDLDPADLRKVVLDSPAAKAALLEPAVPGIEAQIADQRDRLHAWAEVRQAQLSQQLDDHQNDLRAAGRIKTAGPEAAADEADLRSAIERVTAQLAAIPGDCARIEEMLDEAQSPADVAQAAQQIDRLLGMPGAAAAS